MRVLIAPQEFKGSLSSDEAALAIRQGLRQSRPEWTFDILPMSDGGPGFLEALRKAVKADTAATVVHDALGRPVLGRWLRVRDSGEIVIEAAQANGLFHLRADELDPLHADTAGVGELIAEAAREGPSRIVVGVGGSATTDGGAGMARALGARFRGEDGTELPPGGAPLAGLARIDWQPPEWVGRIEVVVATDVTNPLTGPDGAAATYAPQKGADAAQVELLEAALLRYGAVLNRSLGVAVGGIPGGGAAGGLAAGLVAFLGARIESGFDLVARTTHLRERMATCDLVVTGEGSFDSQSLQGKVTGRIVEMATELGKPVVVFAGRAESAAANVRTLMAIAPDPGTAMREADPLLSRLAAEWAAEHP
ncbi:MAG: glycerate kinase [Anaerolinea sp.]|nr:glycerate kinase [Anaerolinea sp.]